MRRYIKIIALLLVALMALPLSACGKKMSEEEMEEACVKATETFVGGYLSNTNTNYLEKYNPYPRTILRTACFDLIPFLIFYNWDVGERVSDYILKHATFEVDPYSFIHEKNSDEASLSVNVTIIPPEAAFNQAKEYLKIPEVNDPTINEEMYNQAISAISGIQPVTISVPVDLAYEDGEWLASGHTTVMRAIMRRVVRNNDATSKRT